MPFMRRRPLLRAAAVGGVAYMGAKAGNQPGHAGPGCPAGAGPTGTGPGTGSGSRASR